MKRFSRGNGFLTAAAMLALILDPETSVRGGSAGVELCIKTVIPALFPFIILSIMLTGQLTGISSPVLTVINNWCRIPPGSETILLTGILGGYPIGAQCICQAYTSGQLDKHNAKRMLGFCSNAGPAFIFGMTPSLFTHTAAPWALWGIHIISALVVSRLLPGESGVTIGTLKSKNISLGQAMHKAVYAMANVCGWVVLFRVIIAFCQRWLLWILPQPGQILFQGLLELTNGCMSLKQIDHEHLRFCFSSIFLGFGGICVGMQTLSITSQACLGTGFYFPGKVMQAAISALLSIPAAILLFPGSTVSPLVYLPALATVITATAVLNFKKNNSSIPVPSGV